MTLGLYIGRLNPPHIGHIETIEKSLKENEKTIVILGSPKIEDSNNPLDFKQRKELLEKKFKNNEGLKIVELMDDDSDLVWTYGIYKILFENGEGINDVNFYAGDFQNDSAYKVLKEYEDKILNHKINYIENSRNNSFVEFEGKKYDISATNLRNALREGYYDLAENFCNKEIFDEIKNLKF